MRTLGNVTLLERPVRLATLVTAVRTAIRARERQYEIANTWRNALGRKNASVVGAVLALAGRLPFSISRRRLTLLSGVAVLNRVAPAKGRK